MQNFTRPTSTLLFSKKIPNRLTKNTKLQILLEAYKLKENNGYELTLQVIHQSKDINFNNLYYQHANNIEIRRCSEPELTGSPFNIECIYIRGDNKERDNATSSIYLHKDINIEAEISKIREVILKFNLFAKQGMYTCKHCKQVHFGTPAIEQDGIKICNLCKKHYTECTVCNSILPKHKNYYLPEKPICEHCWTENQYYVCNGCNQLFSNKIEAERGCGSNEMLLCPHCNTRYPHCNHCNFPLIRQSEEYTCEICNEDSNTIIVLCRHCYYEYHNHASIQAYNFKPLPIFHGAGIQFGIELEIDKIPINSIMNISSKKIINNKQKLGIMLTKKDPKQEKYYLKDDGSLSNGIEIVSHPGDINWHLKKMNWKDIFDTCIEHKATSHKAKTCGLHIHIDKKAFGNSVNLRELNILKLIYTFQKFQREIITFSRRTREDIDRWCNFHWYDKKELYEPKKTCDKQYRSGKYYAINLSNKNTVEIRVFRGTLNLVTFNATIQFMNNMVTYLYNVGIPHLYHVTWPVLIQDIITIHPYKELITYLEQRGLYKTTSILEIEDI